MLIEGGAEINTIAQANKLVSIGVSVQIIVLSDVDKLGTQLDKRVLLQRINTPSLRFLTSKSLFGAIFSLRKISSKISSFSPDHILAILEPSFLVVRLAKALNLIKGRIWIYHRSTEYANVDMQEDRKILNFLYHLFFVKLISNKREHHLFISKAVRDDIQKKEKVHHGHVIHNSITHPILGRRSEDTFLKKFNIENEKYYIIPGRLDPLKGHLFFLQCTHSLIKKYNIKLLISGIGPSEAPLKEFISYNELENNVFLTGSLINEDLLELLSGATLCIIPSISEGLGNVAIESLAVGTTTLCSNAGGLTEVIEHGRTGYVFEKGNEIDLKEKFEALIIDPTLIINPEILKTEYRQKFTIESQIDKLLSILEASK